MRLLNLKPHLSRENKFLLLEVLFPLVPYRLPQYVPLCYKINTLISPLFHSFFPSLFCLSCPSVQPPSDWWHSRHHSSQQPVGSSHRCQDAPRGDAIRQGDFEMMSLSNNNNNSSNRNTPPEMWTCCFVLTWTLS